MRELEEKARRQTKTVRLSRERRKRRPAQPELVAARVSIPDCVADDDIITPYEDIEVR